MNIFLKATLQSMKKSRTRTIVTIIGVILSAAMITAVSTFAFSLQSYMIKASIQKYGGWHVGFMDTDASFAQERALDKGAAHSTTLENIGYAPLAGGKNPNKPYLFITGFSTEAFDTLPITLVSGRMPENSGEILVPSHVAVNGGVRLPVGEALSLTVGSRMNGSQNLGQHDRYIPGKDPGTAKEAFVPKAEKNYTVVGIYERPRFEESSAPGYTLITKADALDKANSFSTFVTLKNPRGVNAYVSKTAGGHAYIYNDNVLRFMGVSSDGLFTLFLYTLGGIVVAIIMVGSVFMIYNAFTISLNERTRQFGILSSVGATAKQLRNSVLFEGLCIGAVGIPIGIILGIGSIWLVISAVSRNFGNILYSNVPLTLTVSVLPIAGAAAVSLVTILISAYIPARKAASTPVMESIRQTNEIKVESKEVKTSRLTQRIYGLEGTLALKNFKRNKRRYRSIVLSLLLSVVLFISTSSFVTDMKQATERAAAFTTYDIGLATLDMKDSDMLSLYEKLKTADGVYESSYQTLVKYSSAAKASDLSEDYWRYAASRSPDETAHLPVDIQLLDDSAYLGIIKNLGLPAEEYTGEHAKMIAVAKITSQTKTKGRGEISQIIDVFRNPSVTLTLSPEADGAPRTEPGKQVRVTLVETVPPDTLPILGSSGSDNPIFFRMLVPYSLKDMLGITDNQVAVKGLTFLSKTPAQSVAEMEKIIQGEGITAEYRLYNTYDMLDENRNMVFIVNVFAYTFIIMISLIAIANVFNTISTNIKLRRRELAMLRSVGMSQRSFQRMMNFECAFYGMRALLFGLPLAVVSSWLIFKGMYAGGADNISFIFPWESIGISVFSVLFIVFITMLYAISKIKRENIIDGLRDDMT